MRVPEMRALAPEEGAPLVQIHCGSCGTQCRLCISAGDWICPNRECDRFCFGLRKQARIQVPVSEEWVLTLEFPEYLFKAGEASVEVGVGWAARDFFKQAAAAGHVGALFGLGQLYAAGGTGVEQDDAKAAECYLEAARQGNLDAMANIGYRYMCGLGIDSDPQQARYWATKAAEAGHALAQSNLGRMCQEGVGGLEDLQAAESWFRKSAAQGNPYGLCNVGLMFLNGVGRGVDFVEAAKWMTRAAEAGYHGAQYNLGIMYLRGDGVEQDEQRAVHWLRASAEQGNASARQMLRQLSLEA